MTIEELAQQVADLQKQFAELNSSDPTQYVGYVPGGVNFRLSSQNSVNPGHRHTTASIDGLSDFFRQTLTAGENINAASSPQAVYLKASDGKVYKLDATSPGEASQNFIGFVDGAQNITSGSSALVLTADRFVCSGFTGLTVGAYYFSTNTAGSISTTAGSNPRLVGQAKSATELVVMITPGYICVVPSTLGNYSAATPVTTTDKITLGFRPRAIRIAYYIQGYWGGLGVAGQKGFVNYFEGSAGLVRSQFVIWKTKAVAGNTSSNDDAFPSNISAFTTEVNANADAATGDQSSNNGISMTLSLDSIDDSSLTMKITIALAGSYVSATSGRCRLLVEAWQ